MIPRARSSPLFVRRISSPKRRPSRLGQFLEQALGARLRSGAQHLRAVRFPLFPKRPEKLQDLVLPVLGHFRRPFGKRPFTKFTTFDSGMGKE